MFDSAHKAFSEITTKADFMSLRLVRENMEIVSVKRGVPDPVVASDDVGAMITVIHEGGLGYAATCDVSPVALGRAADVAFEWARRARGRMVYDTAAVEMPHPRGEYTTHVEKPWQEVGLAEKIDLLKSACDGLQVDDRIVDYTASIWFTDTETLYLTSSGGEVRQRILRIAPFMSATANEGVETQSRSLGGYGLARQAGLEMLDEIDFLSQAATIGEDAIELLSSPNCPSGKLDLVLESDQMILQLHESIGHPLEIDRILGDERNYAGTSFVKLEDFGKLRYGSDLLNVTFDPTVTNEFASYAFDDDGLAADREFIIKDGILMRGLGGDISQARGGVPGVANSRACSWNRPPIDRMANLNLEPGDLALDEMISRVENGVLMRTNCSWSIDDSRNKFQFGCEWGRRIENGKLRGVVKNCNYRGVSESFWRSLDGVGNQGTVNVLGTPFCGKGEPNQAIQVGHSCPAALFRNVDVFGGE